MIEVECVVLDIDDTLYLERDYVRSGFRHVSSWLETHEGLPGFFDAAWTEFSTGRRGDIFNVAIEQLGRPPSPVLIARMVDVYREHPPSIRMEPDAAAFVEALPARSGVVSDGPLASQQRKCAALRLEDRIGLVLLTAAHGAAFYKPSSRAFEYISSHFGVRPALCLYVADNPAKDFEGPKALGWHTIRMRRRQSLHEEIASGRDVDFEISSFDECRDRIQILA